MIKYQNDDIFNANVEALVNTVNCVGVMGRGIALQFKKRFPENFTEYEKACKKNEVVPGKMFVYSTGNILNNRFIINFPTSSHFRCFVVLYHLGCLGHITRLKYNNFNIIKFV